MSKKSVYKDLFKQQIKLEMIHSKYNAVDRMKIFLNPIQDEIIEAMEKLVFTLIDTPEEDFWYTTKDGEVKYWEGKKIIHDYILDKIGIIGLVDMCYTVYVQVFTNNEQRPTLQQVVGSVHGIFKGIEGVRRQLQAVEVCVSEIPYLGFDAPKGAEYAYIYPAGIGLDPEELETFKMQGTALPMLIKPKKVRNNRNIGYRTFTKPLIMAGKSHDKTCNLDHINRRNAIAFRLEPRVRDLVTPVFDPTPKRSRKTGALETEVEVQDRKIAWTLKQESLPIKMAAIVGKPFYFAHRYDTRYRTYAEQYHINYQGDTDDKALIELYHKETIDGDW